MADDHLTAPSDDALPSRGVGLAAGAAVLVACGIALGGAAAQRSAEVADSQAVRAMDASAQTTAPMARYPGGVDARPLDSTRSVGGASPAGMGEAPPPAAGPPRRGGPPGTRPPSGGPPPPVLPERR